MVTSLYVKSWIRERRQDKEDGVTCVEIRGKLLKLSTATQFYHTYHIVAHLVDERKSANGAIVGDHGEHVGLACFRVADTAQLTLVGYQRHHVGTKLFEYRIWKAGEASKGTQFVSESRK